MPQVALTIYEPESVEAPPCRRCGTTAYTGVLLATAATPIDLFIAVTHALDQEGYNLTQNVAGYGYRVLRCDVCWEQRQDAGDNGNFDLPEAE